MITKSSTWTNAHMDISYRGILHNFLSPWAIANGLRGLKTRWCRVSSFSFVTEYTWALSLLTDKRIWRIESGERGGCTSNLFANMYFFHFFVYGTHSWFLSKYFMYTLYISDLWAAVFQPQVIPYSLLQYFSILSLNRHDFPKKQFLSQYLCFDLFYISYLKHFYYKKFRTRIIQKYPYVFTSKGRFSCQIYPKLEFSWHVRKIFKY
jgi:hypothetical protein